MKNQLVTAQAVGDFDGDASIGTAAYEQLRPILAGNTPSTFDEASAAMAPLGWLRPGEVALWWPLHAQGRALGFVVCLGPGLDRDAAFLSQLADVAGGLSQELLERLHRRRRPGLNTPFAEGSLSLDPSWPRDPLRNLDPVVDDPMPTSGAAVHDASLLLKLALEHPNAAVLDAVEALDHWLVAPMTARFLDTGLEALLPILSRAPEARRRLLCLMINSEDTALRHDALHCLERWPDAALAEDILPLAFSADQAVSISAARVLERCRKSANFAVVVLRELRALMRDKRASHAHRRALDLLIRFRDQEAVPLLIQAMTRPGFEQLCRRGLSDLTLVNANWSPAAWTSWFAKHAHEPRSLWLVAALDHRDMEVRSRAIAELYSETGDNFGFQPSAGGRERREAISRARASLSPRPADASP